MKGLVALKVKFNNKNKPMLNSFMIFPKKSMKFVFCDSIFVTIDIFYQTPYLIFSISVGVEHNFLDNVIALPSTFVATHGITCPKES